jgi:hypothetical protein
MFEITYPIVATYTLEETKAETTRTVLAWDESGQPYVLGEKSLVLASSFLGFTGVRLAADIPKDDRPRPVPVVTQPKRPRIEEKPS